MERAEQARRAELLRTYHRAADPLLLPNAWDAASAREVAGAGFKVVATTSGGMAASLGWADGEQTPPTEIFAGVSRIVRAVDVPVTADIESGYGLSPEEIAERLLETGAVGCNLEDTDHTRDGALLGVEAQAERVAALKEATNRRGVDIVVNARIDVFVRHVGEANERVDIAVERARRYARAGADCVYPIGASADDLARFVDRFPGPVNGMVRPEVAPLSRLRMLGLARLSFGSVLERLSSVGLRQRLGMIAAWDDAWTVA
jgi:2-methylisocitrate lyase-like PEP mutase family enzyme